MERFNTSPGKKVLLNVNKLFQLYSFTQGSQRIIDRFLRNSNVMPWMLLPPYTIVFPSSCKSFDDAKGYVVREIDHRTRQTQELFDLLEDKVIISLAVEKVNMDYKIIELDTRLSILKEKFILYRAFSTKITLPTFIDSVISDMLKKSESTKYFDQIDICYWDQKYINDMYSKTKDEIQILEKEIFDIKANTKVEITLHNVGLLNLLK